MLQTQKQHAVWSDVLPPPSFPGFHFLSEPDLEVCKLSILGVDLVQRKSCFVVKIVFGFWFLKDT